MADEPVNCQLLACCHGASRQFISEAKFSKRLTSNMNVKISHNLENNLHNINQVTIKFKLMCFFVPFKKSLKAITKFFSNVYGGVAGYLCSFPQILKQIDGFKHFSEDWFSTVKYNWN